MSVTACDEFMISQKTLWWWFYLEGGDIGWRGSGLDSVMGFDEDVISQSTLWCCVYIHYEGWKDTGLGMVIPCDEGVPACDECMISHNTLWCSRGWGLEADDEYD